MDSVLCVCVFCLHVCVSVYHVYTWCLRWPERELDPQGLDLQMVVSSHVHAGNRTRVL